MEGVLGIKFMHMKNNTWHPEVTAQSVEMMTITNSSGKPRESMVLHVCSAVCEHSATALERTVKCVKPSCNSIRKLQNKASRKTTAVALLENKWDRW